MHEAAEAVDLAVPGQRDELDGPRLARLETHGGAGGDVEAVAARRFAIERERGIGLVEVIV